MNKKFFIVILFISSLAYAMDYTEELSEGLREGDIAKITKVLDSGHITEKDKSEALNKAIVFDHPDVVNILKLLLNKGANVNGISGGDTPLSYALLINRPDIVRILLSDPKIIVEKSDLEQVRQASINYKKQIGVARKKGNKRYAALMRGDKKKADEIGRMLIRHLGLYTGQSGISKQGIVGVGGLPVEVATYIAAFTHD